MELQSCSFDRPVLLEDAHLPWVTLTGSCVTALVGDGLQVDGSLVLARLRATGHGELGAVRLLGAHVCGKLFLRGAELTCDVGSALIGDGLQVDGGLFLDGGFVATGHGELGAVRLLGAHITGPLSLADAKLTNKSGPALYGDRLQVDGSLVLTGEFRAIGHGDGAVRLLGAHITGQLSLQGAELTTDAGPALVGDGIQIDGGLFLTGGFAATGHGELGAVRLVWAHITGPLSLSDAKLTNKSGPALLGDGLRVDGDLFLTEKFRATGHGLVGAVRLSRAHIRGEFFLRGAELTNDAGPALVGDGLQVDSDMAFGEGFRATGHGEGSVVRLLGAHIARQLSLRGVALTNRYGFVLDLEDAEAKQIHLSPEVICPKGLTGRSTCAGARRVYLSGFIYTSLEDSNWNQWLHLIACHTDGYRPQPYQQLATVRRAAGHDTDARKILMVQQDDLRERGELGGWLIKTVHRIWGALAGYGYRTRRTALALLIVLLAAAGLGIGAGYIPTSPGRYVAMHTAQAADPHGPCSLIEQIGVGVDRGLPLGTTGIRNRCDFDTTSFWGQVITAITWVLQAVVWALATLVVVGYTGLIRKTT
jgi:hypothetical protein